MKCGRGLDDPQIKESEICPAAKEKRLHEVHGGKQSGRACWVVAGTYCGGTIQGTFAKKYLACKRCDFHGKVLREEGQNAESTHSLLNRLKGPAKRVDILSKKLGILLGGSGLIGGALMHHFKTHASGEYEVLSPNSKKLSLRETQDIKQYISRYQPDFIINCAIASLDSDAQLAYEINTLGPIRLAKMAQALKIPYIHFSSAATMPPGENLTEDDQLLLTPNLSNYSKSKLMAENILKYMHETQGLDYTVIRLAVVYGKHDHKIQGFHRLLFSIADQAMPFMLSKPGIRHSYSYTKKVPAFVHYILEKREEFGGEAYNFVDKDPVELISLINAIKSQLKVPRPHNICVPYPMAKSAQKMIKWIVRRLGRIGVEIRMPAELLFLKNFYQSQSLSSEKLNKSSFVDPSPDTTVFTELKSMVDYYLVRWKHLNRITDFENEFKNSTKQGREFQNAPIDLLKSITQKSFLPLDDFEDKL